MSIFKYIKNGNILGIRGLVAKSPKVLLSHQTGCPYDSPLQMAIRGNFKRCVEVLCELGADVNEECPLEYHGFLDYPGANAHLIDFAIEECSMDMVELLHSMGACAPCPLAIQQLYEAKLFPDIKELDNYGILPQEETYTKILQMLCMGECGDVIYSIPTPYMWTKHKDCVTLCMRACDGLYLQSLPIDCWYVLLAFCYCFAPWEEGYGYKNPWSLLFL